MRKRRWQTEGPMLRINLKKENKRTNEAICIAVSCIVVLAGLAVCGWIINCGQSKGACKREEMGNEEVCNAR